MATLKDYLRSMGLRSGMEGSGPSTSTSIALADNTDGFVPPCDGYLHFRGELDSLDKWLAMFQLDYGRSYDITGTSPLEDVIRVRKGIPVLFSSKEGMKIKDLKFFKCIGGGYSRYLPTLSCNRFGGALWLRLKTTSETLPRLVAGSRSRVGKLLISNLSVRPRGVGSELTSHLRTGILSYLLMQRTILLPKSFLAMPASSCHRMLQRSGLDALSLVGRGKSVNTPCTVQGSFKERRCSFIPRVACNNARMEVAA